MLFQFCQLLIFLSPWLPFCFLSLSLFSLPLTHTYTDIPIYKNQILDQVVLRSSCYLSKKYGRP